MATKTNEERLYDISDSIEAIEDKIYELIFDLDTEIDEHDYPDWIVDKREKAMDDLDEAMSLLRDANRIVIKVYGNL